jgi:Vps51/Vps67
VPTFNLSAAIDLILKAVSIWLVGRWLFRTDDADIELTDLRAISADSDGARDPSQSFVTRAALLRLKEQASVTLQSSVFTNYGDFISISKEVVSLENEMLELKELIRDWTALPATLDMNEAAMEQHTTVTGSFNSFANGFSGE